MRSKTIVILMAAVIILALLWATGGAIAGPPSQEPGNTGTEAVAATVGDTISYQGRLTDPSTGDPLDGTYTMRFQLYDAETGGTVLWDSGAQSVSVDTGLFNVELDVDQDDFDGQELWLRIGVGGGWLTPRQQLLPVPYALGLVPGATIQGEMDTALLGIFNEGDNAGWLGIGSHGIHAASVVSSTAGVLGTSVDGYGVQGYSAHSIGVFGHAGPFEMPPHPTGEHGVLGWSKSDDGVVGQTDNLQAAGVRGQGGTGVHGIGYTGVLGEGDIGVQGEGTVGVRGDGTTGVDGEGTQVGVHGSATEYNAIGLEGRATLGTGVKGWGETGVHGESSVGVGVLGEGAFGVRGDGTTGVEGEGTQVGVYGSATEYNAIGLEGRATFGTGVKGWGETGVHGESSVGVGVQGDGTTGVEGEGQVGVRGIGSNSGVLGQTTAGNGVEGTSTNGFGGLFHSTNNYGVLGVSRPSVPTYLVVAGHGVVGIGDSDTGEYGGYFLGDGGVYAAEEEDAGVDWAGYFQGDVKITNVLNVDGLAVFNGGKSGFVVDVCQNDDSQPLEAGDIVVISGVAPGVVGDIPAIKVRRASQGSDSAVVGVVDRRFVPGGGEGEEPRYEQGEIAVGEYLTVVTLGAFQGIKVDASYGAIRPGDLLVSSPTPGHAMRATDPKPGALLGKALGSLESGTGMIPVLVTLQ